MISVRDIKKTYHSNKSGDCLAVNGISLEFDNTGLVFIVGKSGSGKSTLLNLMSGMDKQDSGEILIAGKSTTNFTQNDYDIYRNTYVGYVFQDFGLIDELNVSQNIALSAQLQGVNPSENQILESLNKVGLLEYSKRQASELSGGQRQRVSIARALLKDSKIIFADEPTGSLDAVTGKQIFDLFKELSKNRLVIIVSHDMESALRYGDRIITLSDGNVIKDKVKDNDIDLDVIKSEYDKKVDEAFASYTFVPNNNVQEFIRTNTHMPLRVATKMSWQNIKSTKIRFLFALLLSIVALALFCLVDSMRSYDYVTATYANLKQQGVNTLFLNKYYETVNDEGVVVKNYIAMSDSDIDIISEQFGVNYVNIPLSTQIEPYVSESTTVSTTGVVEINDFDDIMEYYNSSLMLGRWPENLSNEYIEIAISDYTADKIMVGGGIFLDDGLVQGEVLPNTGYEEIIDKAYMDDTGIMYKITAIYNTSYKEYKEENVKKKLEFYQQYVWGNVLTVKNAFKQYMLDLLSIPINMMVTADGDFDDAYNFAVNTVSTDKFSIANILAILQADDSVIKYTTKLDIQGNVYNKYSKLSDNEIIISFDYLSAILQNDTITDFDSLSPSQFENLNISLAFDVGNDSKNQYEEPIRIVGVFDSNSISLDNLALLYPQVSGIDAYSILFLNTNMQEKFFDYSMAYNGVFLPLDLSLSSSRNIKILNELTQMNIEANSYMAQDIIFIDTLFALLSKILLYTSIILFGLVVFLVFNFMSSSVSNKKKEIGILRVMGAKGSDTAKIFAVEGLVLFIIALIGSVIATAIGVKLLNTELTSRLVTISTIIVFSPWTALIAILAFALSIFVASAVPLLRIMRLKPIDAVKTK